MLLDPEQKKIDTPSPLREDGDNFRVPTGRGVLSAAEIEALLRPDIPEDAFEPPKSVEPRPVAPFDDEPVAAEPQLEDIAADLAARLTLSLRQACQLPAVVTLGNVQRAPLSFLVSTHAGNPVLVLFRNRQGIQVAGLTIDGNLAAIIIDRACGGSAPLPSLIGNRTFSELDKSILEEVLRPLASAIDPDFSIACIEANRSAAHALLPSGKSILVDLLCDIDGVQGRLGFARLSTEAADTGFKTENDRGVGRLRTRLTARLASLNVPVTRLSDLKAGSVLLLGLPTDQPVELLSGGHQGEVIAEGDVGRKGNKIAVRITKCKPRS